MTIRELSEKVTRRSDALLRLVDQAPPENPQLRETYRQLLKPRAPILARTPFQTPFVDQPAPPQE